MKGGYLVSYVREFPSRGEADRWSLTLLGQHGDAAELTLEREVVAGEVIDAALVKR